MHLRKIKSKKSLKNRVCRRRGKYEDIRSNTERYKKYISYKR